EQELGAPRGADLAAPEWPDAGNGADERALARARRAGQKGGVAAPQREIDVRYEDLPVGSIEVDTDHGEVRGSPLDAAEAARRRCVHPLQCVVEAGEPLDHRAPGRDLFV